MNTITITREATNLTDIERQLAELEAQRVALQASARAVKRAQAFANVAGKTAYIPALEASLSYGTLAILFQTNKKASVALVGVEGQKRAEAIASQCADAIKEAGISLSHENLVELAAFTA